MATFLLLWRAMKTKTAVISALALIASIAMLYVLAIAYRSAHEKSGLQKLVDSTQPDISSEGGLYGYYRIYTGMLICKDCDSIATRIILKSETEESTDGVATFETTRIITGGKPMKQPIQKSLWTVLTGNSERADAKYISLFTDDNNIAAFVIDESLNSAKWKIIVEATRDGDPLSTSQNRVGRLILMSEGKTNP